MSFAFVLFYIISGIIGSLWLCSYATNHQEKLGLYDLGMTMFCMLWGPIALMLAFMFSIFERVRVMNFRGINNPFYKGKKEQS